jgi:hypothetical protein
VFSFGKGVRMICAASVADVPSDVATQCGLLGAAWVASGDVSLSVCFSADSARQVLLSGGFSAWLSVGGLVN